MRNSSADEFYIGSAPRPPRHIARLVVRAVIALNAMALVLAAALVYAQQPFDHSRFEFGTYRDFTGIIETAPYPALLVARAGSASRSRYLLVGEGKHGVEPGLLALAGRTVALRGSLIYRDGQTMIQPRTWKPLAAGATAATASEPLGMVTVTGEIVDSKCYLGVMNPGRTKVHRDCAARCISGGIPPMLITAGGSYLLVGAGGRQLHRELMPMVAETVEVRGRASRSGDTLILEAEPAGDRRLN